MVNCMYVGTIIHISCDLFLLPHRDPGDPWRGPGRSLCWRSPSATQRTRLWPGLRMQPAATDGLASKGPAGGTRYSRWRQPRTEPSGLRRGAEPAAARRVRPCRSCRRPRRRPSPLSRPPSGQNTPATTPASSPASRQTPCLTCRHTEARGCALLVRIQTFLYVGIYWRRIASLAS